MLALLLLLIYWHYWVHINLFGFLLCTADWEEGFLYTRHTNMEQLHSPYGHISKDYTEISRIWFFTHCFSYLPSSVLQSSSQFHEQQLLHYEGQCHQRPRHLCDLQAWHICLYNSSTRVTNRANWSLLKGIHNSK